MKQLRRRISYIALGLLPAAVGARLLNSFGLGAELPFAPIAACVVSLGTADAESLLKACLVFGIFVVSPVFCAVHFLLFSRDASNNSPESAPLRERGDRC